MHFNGERMTAHLDGDFVVFLIGARVNNPWRVHRWLPVMSAMPRMLKELEAHPELGLLSYESYIGRTSLMVQYWRSLDHLMDYAKARNSEHLPAWRAFNHALAASGEVGIWHETYCVRAGAYETVYHHMPAFGLGRAGTLDPAVGRRRHARDRLASNGVGADAA